MNENKTTNNIIAQAMNAYMQKNYQESINLFSKALEDNPENKLCRISRGSAFMSLERFDEALADFDRAVALHPDYARAYHLRGLAELKQGNGLKALADFDKAIELDADYGAAYTSRAAAHQQLGHEDRAAENIATATRLTQVNLETYVNENNVWQTQHMLIEDAMETELNR